MDVISRIVWWVELDDPVNGGNVETSSSDVCAEQDALVGIGELKESLRPLGLFLVSLRPPTSESAHVQQVSI